METSPLGLHHATPRELKERLAAERQGAPLLVYRDAHDSQRIASLSTGDPLTIGRDPRCTVCVDWDDRVSGLHAELSPLAGHWIVADDGLSLNGTFVNGDRVVGRRRLQDGDRIEVGETVLVFVAPAERDRRTTLKGDDRTVPELTPAQRRVLIALCRPLADDDFPRPARNQEIADDLHLTVAAVKTHLRVLFERFGVEALPQNLKRARLVQLALETGAVSSAELDAG